MPRTVLGKPPAVDALLVDGAVVTIRAVNEDDRDALFELYRSASAALIRWRFFTAGRQIIDLEVDRLTRPAADDHVAVVAVDRGRLLAAGSWERTGDDAAEFAVLVREGQHGQGVGTLLVEHLMNLAREAGMTHVSATVLAENVAMLRLLRALGSTQRTRLDSGVVDVVIDLRETPGWQEAVGRRESLAEHASLQRIFAPTAIVVIGAEPDPSSLGARVLAQLETGGYDGTLYAVNPDGASVGRAVGAESVGAIGERVDVAVVTGDAYDVLDVVDDCAVAGVYGIVAMSVGLGASADGPDVAARVRDAGMRLIGPASLGFVATSGGCHVQATFADVRPVSGAVGVSSQSAGVGFALLDHLTRNHVGISSFISVGDKRDVSGNDILMFWEHDDATRICALYLESFGNPRKFARVARRIARRKPIVAIAPARSVTPTAHTATSTGAATPDVARNALLRQAGVIHATSVTAMLDVITVLDRAPLPAGQRVGVVSNSGGASVLTVEAATAAGLDVTELVDLSVRVDPAELVAAAESLLSRDDVDAVLLVHAALSPADAASLASALRPVVTSSVAKPLLAVMLGASSAPDELCDDDGAPLLPCFEFPEPAVAALGAVAGYAQWRSAPDDEVVTFDDVDRPAARRLVREALAARPDGGGLQPWELGALLAAYGIALAPEPGRDDALRLAVSVTVDAFLGPMITVALGAAETELLADRALRLVPVSPAEARDQVRSLRGAPLLSGEAGRGSYDVAAVEELILRLSTLAEDVPEVVHLDLNPVMVQRQGLAIDGAGCVIRPAVASDPYSRRLSPVPR